MKTQDGRKELHTGEFSDTTTVTTKRRRRDITMSSALLEKRNKFYFPAKDNHFDGQEYQKPHRFHSLGFVENYNVAIDVGAHVGTWAVDLARMFDMTICFEPIKEHRDCLRENLADFENKFIIYDCALGDKYEKEISLGYVTEGNSGTASIAAENAEYTADMRTLDSFEFKNVDYLKVDVEGFELQFLKGAADTIKRTKPVINIEIKNNCESFGISRQEIADYICKDLGMTCVGKTVQDYIFKYV